MNELRTAPQLGSVPGPIGPVLPPQTTHMHASAPTSSASAPRQPLDRLASLAVAGRGACCAASSGMAAERGGVVGSASLSVALGGVLGGRSYGSSGRPAGGPQPLPMGSHSSRSPSTRLARHAASSAVRARPDASEPSSTPMHSSHSATSSIRSRSHAELSGPSPMRGGAPMRVAPSQCDGAVGASIEARTYRAKTARPPLAASPRLPCLPWAPEGFAREDLGAVSSSSRYTRRTLLTRCAYAQLGTHDASIERC